MKGGYELFCNMNNIPVIISLLCTIFNSLMIYLSNRRKIKNISDLETSSKVKEEAELLAKVEMIINDVDELKRDYRKTDSRLDEMSNQIVRCEEKLKKQNTEII